MYKIGWFFFDKFKFSQPEFSISQLKVYTLHALEILNMGD